MPSFVCDRCQETLKKPKLDAHVQRCRGASFSCIDCYKHFAGSEYRGHFTCITEVEKYEKRKPAGQPSDAAGKEDPAKSGKPVQGKKAKVMPKEAQTKKEKGASLSAKSSAAAKATNATPDPRSLKDLAETTFRNKASADGKVTLRSLTRSMKKHYQVSRRSFLEKIHVSRVKDQLVLSINYD